VLIADDHELIRSGLERLVEAEDDMSVVGTAADGLRAVTLTARRHPDVVVMDLSMPVLDGLAATREIVRISPETRVLVLTCHARRVVVEAAISAGASGYLYKNVPARDVLDAIRRTYAGERLFLSDRV
jgi:DNA-binding NarL/FixJ family response regulator